MGGEVDLLAFPVKHTLVLVVQVKVLLFRQIPTRPTLHLLQSRESAERQRPQVMNLESTKLIPSG
jgi:hypothetical protein